MRATKLAEDLKPGDRIIEQGTIEQGTVWIAADMQITADKITVDAEVDCRGHGRTFSFVPGDDVPVLPMVIGDGTCAPVDASFKDVDEALAAGWRHCGEEYGDKDYSLKNEYGDTHRDNWFAAVDYPNGNGRGSHHVQLNDVKNRFGYRGGVTELMMPPCSTITVAEEVEYGPAIRHSLETAELAGEFAAFMEGYAAEAAKKPPIEMEL